MKYLLGNFFRKGRSLTLDRLRQIHIDNKAHFVQPMNMSPVKKYDLQFPDNIMIVFVELIEEWKINNLYKLFHNHFEKSLQYLES